MSYYDYDDYSDGNGLDEIFDLQTDMDLQIYMNEEEHHQMDIVFPHLINELDNMNFNININDKDGIILSLKKYLLVNDFNIKDTINESIKALKLKKKKVVSKPITESMYCCKSNIRKNYYL
ncbi:hypothetical protein ACO0R3_003142 [Hanseniaspora guilliermondii]